MRAGAGGGEGAVAVVVVVEEVVGSAGELWLVAVVLASLRSSSCGEKGAERGGGGQQNTGTQDQDQGAVSEGAWSTAPVDCVGMRV